MKFTETTVPGAWLIELEPIADDRGWFARTFDAEEFGAHGLDPGVVHCNLSHNRTAGTLRGLHWQAEPYEEAKLVRCATGAVFDVLVDLRADSPAFCGWTAP